jgi:hypothetical protein
MSEAGEAKRDGASLQKNSGRGNIQKGDALLYEFCVDYKEYKDGFRVSRRNWGKAVSDAWKMKKRPLMKLVLKDKESEHRLRLFVVEEETFLEMLDAWQTQRLSQGMESWH